VKIIALHNPLRRAVSRLATSYGHASPATYDFESALIAEIFELDRVALARLVMRERIRRHTGIAS
jgi:hypothetical protein